MVNVQALWAFAANRAHALLLSKQIVIVLLSQTIFAQRFGTASLRLSLGRALSRYITRLAIALKALAIRMLVKQVRCLPAFAPSTTHLCFAVRI